MDLKKPNTIEEIKSLCFSQDIQTRQNLHSLMINNLARLLVRNNFRVEVESPIFHDHLTLRTRVMEKTQGYIDLVAFGTSLKIAIEFDSRRSLKFKSIEKLLQCDADVLLGIVCGQSKGSDYRTDLDYNRERVLGVMRGLGIYNRKVLLIILSEKISEEVSCGAML